jgi:type II secretory pathway pseudopilin PulG
MNPNSKRASKKQPSKKQQGFALITALGVMVILMGVIGILVVSSVGDLQQSRSSIQLSQARAVAEAGIAVGHDALQGTAVNSLKPIMAGYSTSFANTGDPTTTWVIPQSDWATLASDLETNLNGNTAIKTIATSDLDGVGSAAINYSVSNFRGRQFAATATGSNQSFVMDYAVTSTGTANGGTRTVVEQGSISIQMGRTSLSQWLFLVNDAGGQGGYFDSSSVFNGPVHANKNWGFTGNPTFNDFVSASNGADSDWSKSGMTAPTTDEQGIYYWCPSRSTKANLATSKPPCSVPDFKKGFSYIKEPIALPTSALGQQRAALGLNPTTDVVNNATGVAPADGIPDEPTALEICQKLKLSASCSPTPAVPATGVYIPNDGTAAKNITGGIYIQGDVDSLTLSNPKPGQGLQRYVIKQGTTTTTINIDQINKTTSVTTSPGGTVNYTGAPNGQAPVTTGGANGQIYVSGKIKALTGPTRTGTVTANSPQHPVPTTIPPALAKETQLNITATGQVGITGDLTYECDPTQLATPSYITLNPDCDLSGQPLKTVLGVMSTGSDVQVKDTSPNDIYLWGSFYTAQPGKGLSVENYNSRPTSDSGTMHLYGSLIQDQDQYRAQSVSATVVRGFRESFDYDSRFMNGAITPPNFPTTRTFAPTINAPVALTFTEK